MSGSAVVRRCAPSRVVLVAMGALVATGCGDGSILGTNAVDAGDVHVASDARDVATLDAPRADVTPLDAADVPEVDTADAPDVALVDAADVVDAVDAFDAADVVDAADALDVVRLDAADVSDVPAIDASPPGPGILGSAAQFTILAGSSVSNTGLSTIVGEVGVAPGLALVGIPAGTVVHAGDPVAALAQADTTAAYNNLAGLPCGTTLTGTDLGGLTLAPGVYCFTSSAMLTGTLVLDGQGQPDPLFVFQIASTLVTANAAAVQLINNARACDVFWQTGSSATIGIGSMFAGNLVALSSVTLTTGVALEGRALARSGGVTMDTNAVSNASCPDPAFPVVTDAGPRDAAASDDHTDSAPDGG